MRFFRIEILRNIQRHIPHSALHPARFNTRHKRAAEASFLAVTSVGGIFRLITD